MFEALRRFVSDLAEGETHPNRFAENDYRLAAAALLVHAVDLDEAATNELLNAATAAEQQAIDLYHFTSLLDRSLDEDGRRRVVEMMWEIVFVDGRVSDFEDKLIWRAADLLGVSTRERVELRQRVAASRGTSA